MDTLIKQNGLVIEAAENLYTTIKDLCRRSKDINTSIERIMTFYDSFSKEIESFKKTCNICKSRTQLIIEEEIYSHEEYLKQGISIIEKDLNYLKGKSIPKETIDMLNTKKQNLISNKFEYSLDTQLPNFIEDIGPRPLIENDNHDDQKDRFLLSLDNLFSSNERDRAFIKRSLLVDWDILYKTFITVNNDIIIKEQELQNKRAFAEKNITPLIDQIQIKVNNNKNKMNEYISNLQGQQEKIELNLNFWKKNTAEELSSLQKTCKELKKRR